MAKPPEAAVAQAPERSVVHRIRHPAALFVARRLATGLVTLLVVSVVIFAATNVLPGNVAEVLLGREATPARLHAFEAELELDRPAALRYVSWLGAALRGDLGRSAVAQAEGRTTRVTTTLGEPLLDSFVLGALTAALLIPLTLLLGMLAGRFAGRKLDHAISLPALVLGGLPEFVTGTLLIVVFSRELDLLPPVALLNPGQSPFSNPTALVLPVLTLLTVALGAGVWQVRAGVAEVLQQDYVHFARLNGIKERRIVRRYALRNALAPSVQIIAQNLRYLVGGVIIVESVFAYPGIGTYLVRAVTSRDVTEVQAASLVLAALYVGINIVADLLVVFLVPKLRTGMA